MELFVFHNPPGRQEITPRKTNDVGGPRHVCLRVTNIDEVFAHVKSVVQCGFGRSELTHRNQSSNLLSNRHLVIRWATKEGHNALHCSDLNAYSSLARNACGRGIAAIGLLLAWRLAPAAKK